jgi:hypothetical protein
MEEGSQTDTAMLLHRAANAKTAMPSVHANVAAADPPRRTATAAAQCCAAAKKWLDTLDKSFRDYYCALQQLLHCNKTRESSS